MLDVSELGQPRSTQRYEKGQLGDEQILRERIVSLAIASTAAMATAE